MDCLHRSTWLRIPAPRVLLGLLRSFKHTGSRTRYCTSTDFACPKHPRNTCFCPTHEQALSLVKAWQFYRNADNVGTLAAQSLLAWPGIASVGPPQATTEFRPRLETGSSRPACILTILTRESWRRDPTVKKMWNVTHGKKDVECHQTRSNQGSRNRHWCCRRKQNKRTVKEAALGQAADVLLRDGISI